ncbi:RICIN domain-containing protein [Streptomyces sp. NPDC050600]|uniref:RICIN domain-containing protein n=1 Tax=unclassified Streptomyces TaxID=2593676 RepID=UPI003416E499
MNDFPTGEFIIRNVFSEKVLDVADRSTEPGHEVVVFDRKRNDHDSQLWRYEDGYLINKNSGLVLQVPGRDGGGNIDPGTILTQGVKAERALNQLWACKNNLLMPYDPAVAITAQGGEFTLGTSAVVEKYEMGDSKFEWMFDTP